MRVVIFYQSSSLLLLSSSPLLASSRSKYRTSTASLRQIAVGTTGHQQQAPDRSRRYRTSAASARSQWALLDLNSRRQIAVGTTGPQQQSPDPSAHYWTSTASARSQRQTHNHKHTTTETHSHKHSRKHTHNQKHAIANTTTDTQSHTHSEAHSETHNYRYNTLPGTTGPQLGKRRNLTCPRDCRLMICMSQQQRLLHSQAEAMKKSLICGQALTTMPIYRRTHTLSAEGASELELDGDAWLLLYVQDAWQCKCKPGPCCMYAVHGNIAPHHGVKANH